MPPSPNQTAPIPQAPREPHASRTVVPFRAAAPRRFRRAEAAQGERGAILLFTGVRYERRPEPEAGAPIPQRRWS